VKNESAEVFLLFCVNAKRNCQTTTTPTTPPTTPAPATIKTTVKTGRKNNDVENKYKDDDENDDDDIRKGATCVLLHFGTVYREMLFSPHLSKFNQQMLRPYDNQMHLLKIFLKQFFSL